MEKEEDMLKLTVGKTGNENYSTIQEAIDAIRYNTKGIIEISEGVYNEKIFSDKKDITLIGKGDVVISFSDFARKKADKYEKMGTFRSYTAFFSGEKLKVENITFENNAGHGEEKGQAVALYLDSKTSHLINCTIKAHQDTLFIAPLPQKEREKNGFFGPRTFSKRTLSTLLFENGNIHGDIDFIFGSGDALFLNSTIHSNGKGFITAPSTKKNGIGFIFKKCSFTSSNLEKNTVNLMRPWRKYGKARFLDCFFDGHIKKEKMTSFSGHEKDLETATVYIMTSNSDNFVKLTEIETEIGKIIKRFKKNDAALQ